MPEAPRILQQKLALDGQASKKVAAFRTKVGPQIALEVDNQPDTVILWLEASNDLIDVASLRKRYAPSDTQLKLERLKR